jgi:hypothetical protein
MAHPMAQETIPSPETIGDVGRMAFQDLQDSTSERLGDAVIGIQLKDPIARGMLNAQIPLL